MSRITSTSDSASAFAPWSLASRTSSPRRNRYISGQGVGLTMRDRMPSWPSRRASAVSEPQPSPSALMCVDIATERPARSSCARRSIDSRRCCGTLRRSSTAFRAGQLRMLPAVQEVDREAEDHPDDEPLPCCTGQTRHHVAANQDSENRNEWYERRPEGSGQVRRFVAQNDDAGADDHEREQSSDRHQLTQQSDREESSDHAGDYARQDRGDVGSLELGMNLSEDRRQESVPSHRVEDPGLS